MTLTGCQEYWKASRKRRQGANRREVVRGGGGVAHAMLLCSLQVPHAVLWGGRGQTKRKGVQGRARPSGPHLVAVPLRRSRVT